MVLRCADGSPLAGGTSIDVQTLGLEATAKSAELQSGSADGTIVSPPRSPRDQRKSLGRNGVSPRTQAQFRLEHSLPACPIQVSGSFLPALMSPEEAEHRAKVVARLSTGEAVHRRQRESTDFRIRHLRSRSLSPSVRTGSRTVSPQGRLAAEAARRAERAAQSQSPTVELTVDERATLAAIKRLSDETAAMELASEAMRHQLAVEAEIKQARDAPKVRTVSSKQFGARLAALQTARLQEHELPEALRQGDARLSWPRRSPNQQDCIGAISRAERSVRLQQWRSQLMGTPPKTMADARQEKLDAALAAIPAALQRHDQKKMEAAASVGAGAARRGRGVGAASSADGEQSDMQRDYTSMDWLHMIGRARLRSPERRRVQRYS